MGSSVTEAAKTPSCSTMMRSGFYFFFCLSLSSALVVDGRIIVETISVENGTLRWDVVDDGQYGGDGGEDWTDAEAFLEHGWPTAINVRSGDSLDGLTVKYGNIWGEYHGGKGGDSQSCMWDTEDTVIIVRGQIGTKWDNIFELELITATGHACGPYGAGGNGEEWISVHPGCNLAYLSGNSGDVIDGLSLHWICESKIHSH